MLANERKCELPVASIARRSDSRGATLRCVSHNPLPEDRRRQSHPLPLLALVEAVAAVVVGAVRCHSVRAPLVVGSIALPDGVKWDT